MRRLWVLFAGILLVGCGAVTNGVTATVNTTATRSAELGQIATLSAQITPASGAVVAATTASTVAATPSMIAMTPTPLQVAATPLVVSTPTFSPSQVVTVLGDAVNLRQSPDVASAVVVLVPPGADAVVIGDDVTGPDGVTRYVHARVGDKEGYLRSDLVSAPHVATPAPPTPVPTATAIRPTAEPDYDAAYPLIDAADWAKRPDFYTGKQFSVIGDAFNVHEQNGVTTFQMNAGTSLDTTVPVGIIFDSPSPGLVDGKKLRAYGVGKGTFTGTNGFGASITQPLMSAVLLGPPNEAANNATAVRENADRQATGTALIGKVRTGLITATALAHEIDGINATADAVNRSTYATLTAIAKKP